jgi:phosphate transport system permease protein
MSNVDDTRSELVQSDTGAIAAAGSAVVGASVLVFLVAWLAIFEVFPITRSVGPVTVHDLFGGALLLAGLAVLGFGVASRTGLANTDPNRSAGMVASVVLGVIWTIVGCLVASQTVGLSSILLWAPAGALVGVLATAVGLLLPEDLGSTIPVGVLTALAGGVFLLGIIGPGWTWHPNGLSGTFTAPITVPLVAVFSSLLVGWVAAKASAGFGADGRQSGAYLLVYLTAAIMLTVLALLIFFVVSNGYRALFAGASLSPFEWPFVTEQRALFGEPVPILGRPSGILPAIVGTVWLVVGSVLLAVPLGVGAAVFLTEYAEQGRFTQVVEVATNGLWSTPSIVFGLFGYAFIVLRLGSRSLFAGMVVLGAMLLPLVLITSREAMKSVPDSYRDASAALGVSKWQTIRSVVIPAAIPGITTGTILGVGRIAGETAPILLVTSGGSSPLPTEIETQSIIGGFEFIARPPFVANEALFNAGHTALPYQLYVLITAGQGEALGITDPVGFQWGVALVLLLVVLSFYVVGIVTRNYFRRQLHQ